MLAFVRVSGFFEQWFEVPTWQEILNYVLGVLDHWGVFQFIVATFVLTLAFAALALLARLAFKG